MVNLQTLKYAFKQLLCQILNKTNPSNEFLNIFIKKMLEAVVSILYLINKIFLLFNKRTGWTIGAVASGTAMIYFFGIQLYIFCALEAACLCIMIYGAVGKVTSKRITYYVYSICAAVTVFLLIQIQETGLLEFATSLLFMMAFLYLADGKRKLGWILLGLAHLIMAYITYSKAQYFFSSLQVISVFVSFLGAQKPLMKWKAVVLS